MTLIEYCSKLLNNRDASMVQMYWTQKRTQKGLKNDLTFRIYFDKIIKVGTVPQNHYFNLKEV